MKPQHDVDRRIINITLKNHPLERMVKQTTRIENGPLPMLQLWFISHGKMPLHCKLYTASCSESTLLGFRSKYCVNYLSEYIFAFGI